MVDRQADDDGLCAKLPCGQNLAQLQIRCGGWPGLAAQALHLTQSMVALPGIVPGLTEPAWSFSTKVYITNCFLRLVNSPLHPPRISEENPGT